MLENRVFGQAVGGEYGENVIPIGSRILKHLIGRKQI